MRAVNAAAEQAERLAAEVERAAGGSGGWLSRVTACLGVRERALQAINRAQSLTAGGRRPTFVSVEAGNQVWAELRARLDEADRRSSAACAAIERG